MSIPILQPLASRNFRLLWIGSLVSMVGGNLTIIAFPWLVLRLTGDSLAMGTVLALSTIPRAVFMVFGGALTDRFSARTIMIWSNVCRAILMAMLAYLVLTDTIAMWVVYVTALLFGVMDAFFWPASSAFVPQLVEGEQLPAANALIQGTGQISVMLGPFAAGLMIALFEGDSETGSASLVGIGLVFVIDTLGFLVSIVTLTMISFQGAQDRTEALTVGSVMHSIRQGFATLWGDLPLRIMTLVFMVFSLFWRGPYMIGIPVLCDARFPEGALAFGLISSAFGVGAFLGTVGGGSLPRFPEVWLGRLVLVDILVLGASFMVYAVTPTVTWALVASVVCGALDGYVMIVLISWIQLRIPTGMLGRVMSVIMFFVSGLGPVSAALAGFFIQWSLIGVFFVAGGFLISLAIVGSCFRITRSMGFAGGAPADRVAFTES